MTKEARCQRGRRDLPRDRLNMPRPLREYGVPEGEFFVALLPLGCYGAG
ncbi:MAG: hypothetical protein ACXWD8_05675 [Mycobacterium sp.]